MKLLIIEDEDMLVKVQKRLFEGEGYSVETISRLKDLDWVVEKKDFFPDIVILDPFNDYNFPDVSADFLIDSLIKGSLEKIFQIDPSVRVTISSCWDLKDNVKRMKQKFPGRNFSFHNKLWKDATEKLLELVKSTTKEAGL